MKILRDLNLYPKKRRTGFILIAFSVLISASIISGGVFLWLNNSTFSILTLIIFSELASLALISIPILIMAYRHSRPREKLKKSIRNIGEGCFYKQLDSNKEKIYSDIAESINEAGQMLTDKMQSILLNTRRLSALEEELSASFKANPSYDSHTKALICQLKICTSRLRNDLNEFTLENSTQLSSDKSEENRIYSSSSV